MNGFAGPSTHRCKCFGEGDGPDGQWAACPPELCEAARLLDIVGEQHDEIVELELRLAAYRKRPLAPSTTSALSKLLDAVSENRHHDAYELGAPAEMELYLMHDLFFQYVGTDFANVVQSRKRTTVDDEETFGPDDGWYDKAAGLHNTQEPGS